MAQTSTGTGEKKQNTDKGEYVYKKKKCLYML